MTRILENRVSVRGRGVQRCLRNGTIKIYTDDKSYVNLGRVTKEELPVYGRNWKNFFNSLICPRKKKPYAKFCGETFLQLATLRGPSLTAMLNQGKGKTGFDP